jgi:N-acyl-L-homoserine lactone synthetase
MKKLFRFRYRTYCLEKQYLPAVNYPEQAEYDELDVYSFQLSVWDILNPGRLLGCVRLIPPNPRGLPCIDHFAIADRTVTSENSAEISRFIISSEARSNERRNVFKKLCQMTYRLLLSHRLSNCYMITDERFYKLICRMGFPYKRLGPTLPFMGGTFPCVVPTEELTKVPWLQDDPFKNAA